MRILTEGDPRPVRASAAAVGFFDGVHFGHRFLLENVKAVARARGLATMVVTFPTHPLATLRPAKCPPMLTTTAERMALIEAMGINQCALIDFTPEFSRLSAEEFMRIYLVGKLNVKALVIGYDHTIGHDRDTSFEGYRLMGERLGINVVRAAKYMPPSGVEVSSTAIREAIMRGDVARASAMLGRPYNLAGRVVEGHHVGTGLGFPTANINAIDSGKVIPMDGVYSAEAVIGGAAHAAVVNIGCRPTLNNGDDTTIEAFLPGFSGNLYGEDVNLRFLARLRDEKRFANTLELREQIARDVQAATAATGEA